VHDPTPLDELEQQFLDSQVARNHSYKTLAHYRSSFRSFHQFLDEGDRPLTDQSLTKEAIRAYAAWLKETPTRGWRGSNERTLQGLHGRLRDLRAFTRWLEAEELIDRAPRIELPKLPQEEFPVMSDEEIKVLFTCEHLAAKGDQAVRNRALISLMIDTGLRRSEVASAELDDVDLTDQLILVTGKGNKQRRVPFSSGVLDLLQKWLTVRGNEPGSLFWLSSEGVYQLFRRIQKETGLKIHPHLLRHQAASMMVRNNADIYSVRRVLGHSSVTVTEKYVTQNYQELRERHAAASPFEAVREVMPSLKPKPRKRRLEL
jgi:site-specific recombinase XerD